MRAQPLLRTFFTLSQHCRLSRNANPANQHLPQRGGGTSPARCRPHHRLIRNVQPIPLSRGYREGRAVPATPSGPGFYIESCFLPRVFSSVLFHLCFAPSNVERGSRGNHRRFPLLLSLPFQRERKKHKTISAPVQTQQETNSLLSTFINPFPHCRLMRNANPA